MVKSTLLCVALALTPMLAQIPATDAKQIAKAVDRRYADLDTLKLDFT
jgi:outer membrane lipoprotein-sorting protein